MWTQSVQVCCSEFAKQTSRDFRMVLYLVFLSERRGGRMVSALNSGSGGPGLRPGQDTAL